MRTVYLLHLARPLGNPMNPRAMAQHYLGWAVNLSARLADHRAGRGSGLTRAAVAQGITFEVAATWPGDYHLEKVLKARKMGWRLCPCCRPAAARQLELPLFAPRSIEQLALPLDDSDLWPEAPASRPDRGWEIMLLRDWEFARGGLRPAVDLAQFDLL